jgi:hypothetical protein
MGRARRYRILTLLLAVLATGGATATTRAAYAEVGRPAALSVAIAAPDRESTPRRQLDDTGPRSRFDTDRQPSLPGPQPPRTQRSAPFYDLYCSRLC